MNWIEQVMAATEYAETPRSFIRWAALSALSAVAAPNVFLDKVFYKLSPNIYTLILAKSGLGKGFPVSLAKALVKKAHCTRVIDGRNSIQSMIKELGTIKTGPNNNGTINLKDSRGFLISGEFADFVTYDPQAFIILTDLYDTHYNEEWKNSFKNTGIDVLKNPCLTMLAASSPVHFKECLPTASITGGFIGRTLLIYEDKRSRINPLIDKPEVVFSIDQLSEYLAKLSEIKGEFQWSPSGRQVFEPWYEQYRIRGDADNSDTTGTEQRMNDHVLKIAMLLQLAEDYNELTITGRHVATAIALCEEVAKNAKRNLLTEGKSASKDHVKVVLESLFKSKDFTSSRSLMMSNNWGHINTIELDVAVESLKQMGFLEEFTHKDQIYYKLGPKAIKIFFSQIQEGKVQ